MNEWHDDEEIDKNHERETERGWVEQIERETHVKELNRQILLSLITSGSKIGVTELRWTVRKAAIEFVKEDIRVTRTKGEILSNFS